MQNVVFKILFKIIEMNVKNKNNSGAIREFGAFITEAITSVNGVLLRPLCSKQL
jgi:hypothetical protein